MFVLLLMLCLGAHAEVTAQQQQQQQQQQQGVLCLTPTVNGQGMCNVSSVAVCHTPGPSFIVGECVNVPGLALPSNQPFQSWKFVELAPVRGGYLEYGIALFSNASCSGVLVSGSYCTQGACCQFSNFPTFAKFSLNGTAYDGFVAGVPPPPPYSTPMIVGLVLGLGIPILSLVVIAVYYYRKRGGYDHVRQLDDDLM